VKGSRDIQTGRIFSGHPPYVRPLSLLGVVLNSYINGFNHLFIQLSFIGFKKPGISYNIETLAATCLYFSISAQGLLPSPNLVPVVASNLRQSYPPRPAAQPQTKLIEWQPTPSPALDTKLGPGGIVFRQQPAPGVQGEAAGKVQTCRHYGHRISFGINKEVFPLFPLSGNQLQFVVPLE